MDRHEPAPEDGLFAYQNRRYVRAPRPVHFPSEERPADHVSETKRHLLARTTLFLMLENARLSAALGSIQFVYWDASDPQKCLSPDVFVKLGSDAKDFDSWKIWERGAPELAVEIVSDSDRSEGEWAIKLARYQASGIAEVVRFDPESQSAPLRVWDRVKGDLVERAPGSAGLWECGALDLFWVVVSTDLGPCLRLSRDREGTQLLATASEERIQLREALAEEQRARAKAEHERLLAEHARSLAEQARKEAEEKALGERRTREEAEREVERLRAELARLREGR
jgi:hypothetical protein